MSHEEFAVAAQQMRAIAANAEGLEVFMIRKDCATLHIPGRACCSSLKSFHKAHPDVRWHLHRKKPFVPSTRYGLGVFAKFFQAEFVPRQEDADLCRSCFGWSGLHPGVRANDAVLREHFAGMHVARVSDATPTRSFLTVAGDYTHRPVMPTEWVRGTATETGDAVCHAALLDGACPDARAHALVANHELGAAHYYCYLCFRKDAPLRIDVVAAEAVKTNLL